MRKWFKRRLPVLLLALCLVGSMFPTVFAASNNATSAAAAAAIQQANEGNNFLESLDVVDPDKITPITIKATGEHAHEIYQEEVGTLLGTANSGVDYYCAAIWPEGGTAADVRYTKLEKSGNRLLLTYRWNWSGDKTVYAMVVEPVLVSLDLKSNGGGTSTITTKPDMGTIYHFRDTNATYDVPFSTTLKISDGLAKVAKTFLPYQRYKAFWDALEFTCYIRIPEALELPAGNLMNHISFVGNTPFTIVSAERAAAPEHGVNVTCRLNGTGTPGIENTVNNFYNEADGTFKLTDTMQIVGTAKISGTSVQELYDKGQKIIHTVGSTTLSGFPQIALTPEFVKDPYVPGEDHSLTDEWILQHPEWDTKESLQVPAMAYPIRLVVLGNGGENPDIHPVDPGDTGVGDLLNTKDHIAYMQGDEKGMFRPYANITRAEVVQMFYNLLLRQDMDTSGVARFKDVPNNAWYAKAVYALTSLGIVKGAGNGEFAPYRNITRAEFAVIASRFAKKNYEASTGMTFSDVPTSHWAYHEITRATSYGWIKGNGQGQFLPNRNLSRAEAAAITNRMLRRLGDRSTINESEIIRRFPDVASRSEWFYYEVYEATTRHDYTFNATEEDWTKVYPWNGFWQHW